MNGSQEKRSPKIAYTEENLKIIRRTYVIGIILWILIIIILDLYPKNLFELLILSIPFVIFLIDFTYAEDLIIESGDDNWSSNFLSLGILFIIPFLSWIKQDKNVEDMRKFIHIALVSIILTLFSLIDLWIPRKSAIFIRSLRSIFSTLSIVLILYAIVLYMSEIDI